MLATTCSSFPPLKKVEKYDSIKVKQCSRLTQVGYENISRPWETYKEYGSNTVSNLQSLLPQVDYGSAFNPPNSITEKQNELCRLKALFPFWVVVRRSVLRELEEASRKLEKLEEISEITSSVNRSVGITGAVAAVAGSILLPFTFGLSSAGIVSGAVVSLSSVTAMTASKVAERRSVLQLLSKCYRLIDLDREWRHRLLKDMDSVEEKVPQDFLNSCRLPFRRNVHDILAHLKSFILPRSEQNVLDDYLPTSQGLSESEGLLGDGGVSTERKITNRKKSSVNDAVFHSTRDYNTLMYLATIVQSRLSMCVTTDKDEMEREMQRSLQIQLIKLDEIVPQLSNEVESSGQPENDSQTKIPDNAKLGSEGPSEKLIIFEEMFFKAMGKYRNGKNIHYTSKSRKSRSKPKSIRSLIYILKDLTNLYYDQLFMFSGYHQFLVQEHKNFCCKHECVRLFYY